MENPTFVIVEQICQLRPHLARHHVEQLCRRFPRFRLDTDKSSTTTSDPTEDPAVFLLGQITVPDGSQFIHLETIVVVPQLYPLVQPTCQILPPFDMQIKPGCKYIDVAGKINNDALNYTWQPDMSNLEGYMHAVIASCRHVCPVEPSIDLIENESMYDSSTMARRAIGSDSTGPIVSMLTLSRRGRRPQSQPPPTSSSRHEMIVSALSVMNIEMESRKAKVERVIAKTAVEYKKAPQNVLDQINAEKQQVQNTIAANRPLINKLKAKAHDMDQEQTDVSELVAGSNPVSQQYIEVRAQMMAQQDCLQWLTISLERELIDTQEYLQHVRSLATDMFKTTMLLSRINNVLN